MNPDRTWNGDAEVKFTERHTKEDEEEVCEGEMQDEELQQQSRGTSAAQRRGTSAAEKKKRKD
ncbi:hypothetical protein DVH24_015617 [Malus domestica]|uniref:Uncharacterized protein n=1 Tax=Malus domestica TaxID=3750 RepID=A0A498HN68_MALDO|nr:hypothetical protein DVH24_015617 [Malus domestica]